MDETTGGRCVEPGTFGREEEERDEKLGIGESDGEGVGDPDSDELDEVARERPREKRYSARFITKVGALVALPHEVLCREKASAVTCSTKGCMATRDVTR